jgi:predicted RNA-binding protein with PIN domain
VFDGQKGGKEERLRDSMAVLYASAGETADSIIERIAQAHSGQREIGVVTADHAEMTAVESFGAFGFSPDWLQNELLAADAEIEETILRERKKKLT